jgi:hypothetical protein
MRIYSNMLYVNERIKIDLSKYEVHFFQRNCTLFKQ